MANLYDLMGEYGALQQAMDKHDLTDEDMKALLDSLDEAKGSLREKVNNIVKLLSGLNGDIGRYKHEEQRLATRRKAMENKKERLREWIRLSMEVFEVPSMKTDVHTVTLTQGKEKVVVVDESLVPEEYVRVKREVNREAVLRSYKSDGEIVDGCDIIPGERKLTIR